MRIKQLIKKLQEVEDDYGDVIVAVDDLQLVSIEIERIGYLVVVNLSHDAKKVTPE